MMPIAWTKSYKGGRIFTTTMGSAEDLLNEGIPTAAGERLLLLGGGVGGDSATSRRCGFGGELIDPLPFGFGGAAKGLRPGR